MSLHLGIFQVTAAATAATASQQLSPFGKALGPSRPGTKYPVRESLTSMNLSVVILSSSDVSNIDCPRKDGGG